LIRRMSRFSAGIRTVAVAMVFLLWSPSSLGNCAPGVKDEVRCDDAASPGGSTLKEPGWGRARLDDDAGHSHLPGG
jgi:hypothetical protein